MKIRGLEAKGTDEGRLVPGDHPLGDGATQGSLSRACFISFLHMTHTLTHTDFSEAAFGAGSFAVV